MQSLFPVQGGHWHKKPTGTTKSHIYGAQQGQIAEQYPPKERQGQVVGVAVGVGGGVVGVGVGGGVVGVGVAVGAHQSHQGLKSVQFQAVPSLLHALHLVEQTAEETHSVAFGVQTGVGAGPPPHKSGEQGSQYQKFAVQ